MHSPGQLILLLSFIPFIAWGMFSALSSLDGKWDGRGIALWGLTAMWFGLPALGVLSLSFIMGDFSLSLPYLIVAASEVFVSLFILTLVAVFKNGEKHGKKTVGR